MAKFLQRLAKIAQMSVAGRRHRRVARAGTGGERHHRVTGRGIAVDGDAVEAFIDRPFQQGLQHRRRHRRVSEHKRQHSRHVRLNHARPLGDTVQGDGDIANFRLPHRRFGEGVGGHNRGCRAGPVMIAQITGGAG